jgi:Lrp/AsnC family leucine-responsive transcriptional regulator
MPTLDDTDRRILELLQQNARATNAEIAEEVGLTASSVFERIRKLEDRKVIRGFTAQVDPAALGKPLTAFIRLTVAYDEKHPGGMAALRADPDVLECYSVAGEDCFILKTRVDGPGALEALINRIRQQFTVQRSVTMIALSALKEGGVLLASAPEVEAGTNGHKPAGVKRKA